MVIATITTDMACMNNSDIPLVDLHTHILPCIDDGAENADEAIKLLLAEKRQGVSHVVLTPHFDLKNSDIELFIKKRNTSFKLLSEKINATGLCADIGLHCGAEVTYNPELISLDVSSLCIEKTSYLLLEAPANVPLNFESTVMHMLANGIVPILAHIERSPYLCENFALLDYLAGEGVLFQCNATLFLEVGYKNIAAELLKHGYPHILASDTHSIAKRPPYLKEALIKSKKNANRFIYNAFCVINNHCL